jgi:hypothetical protein
MAKAFIELKQGNRKHKLNASDISKVYKITKRTTPSIPSFGKIVKYMPETDDETEATLAI